MTNLRLFLLLLLAGVILTTFTIIAMFIIINVCIKKKVIKFRLSNDYTTRSRVQSMIPVSETKAPPLPSRDQFCSEESDANSYEDVDDLPEYLKVEEETENVPQNTDFHSFNTWANHQPSTINHQDQISTSENYDDVDQLDHSEPKNYDDLISLPDYVDLEDDTSALPMPPLFLVDGAQCEDGQSVSDSYDDVVGLNSASEDYDDVG